LHPTAGPLTVTGPPVKLSATPASVSTAAPLLGEHTRQALAELLDLGSAELDNLESAEVIVAGWMASAITHCIVGASLALPAVEAQSIRAAMPRWAIPVSCGLLAVAPDLDTIVMRALDIPYGSFFGHRGFFHSPFFLILFSALMSRR